MVEINLHTCVHFGIYSCGQFWPPGVPDIVIFTITLTFQLTIFSIYCPFLSGGHFAPAALDYICASFERMD